MSGISQDYIVDYIRGLVKEDSEILKELEKYALENNVPIVQIEVANFLKLMMKIHKPKKILELGTAIGYSAILMSIATNNTSSITTIERDKNMLDIARQNIANLGLENKIDVIEGDCLEILPTLEHEYDLIFMDAGKGHYNEFLPYCLKLLKREGIIIADNVLFRGMVASDDLVKRRKITIVKRMRSYLETISSDKGLLTSVIPMGDGIAVTTRRDTDE
jgi:predicted O-methyltransferase YrrM